MTEHDLEKVENLNIDLKNLRRTADSLVHGHWVGIASADYPAPYCFTTQYARDKYKQFIQDLLSDLEYTVINTNIDWSNSND